ncbi:MAG: glycoside hydrolase family 10 protein [Candidatus Aphodosoma sp.]
MRYRIICLFALLTLVFVKSFAVNNLNNKVEFRAAWIATVANIDWPLAGCIDTDMQQKHMIQLLDSLQKLNFNAVIFQIRPTADAFYQSDLEPWSRFLTGKQGQEPDPYYDPLAFVIHEAHKRFIDVHVWLNPYRLLNADDLNLLSPNHIYYKHPELFVKYGNQYYFNPCLPETRSFLYSVVSDIVSRYDVDAVHFDDYFYPYRIVGKEFPDAQYFQNSSNFDNIGDWRRNNVNIVIKELSDTIKKIKPWVEFGISPFGVWRNYNVDPNGSKTTAGQTNYDDLYADVLLWLKNGWIDYVVPQLYWEIGKKAADYRILAKWWNDNCFGKNLYIGLSSSNLNTAKPNAWNVPNEICRQLTLNDSIKNISGEVYFSCKTLLENRQGLCDSISNTYYHNVALLPACNFPQSKPAQEPRNIRVEKIESRHYIMWDEPEDADPGQNSYYVVYMFEDDDRIDISTPAKILFKTRENCVDLSTINSKSRSLRFVITAVNRYHRESSFSYMIKYKNKR